MPPNGPSTRRLPGLSASMFLSAWRPTCGERIILDGTRRCNCVIERFGGHDCILGSHERLKTLLYWQDRHMCPAGNDIDAISLVTFMLSALLRVVGLGRLRAELILPHGHSSGLALFTFDSHFVPQPNTRVPSYLLHCERHWPYLHLLPHARYSTRCCMTELLESSIEYSASHLSIWLASQAI